MRKLIIIGKILLAVIVIGILSIVVKYAGTIRTAVSQNSIKGVAGAQTSFEKEIKQNVNDYANSAKDQVMNIKVSDIVNGISRVNKINRDIQSAKKYISEQITGLLKNYGRPTNASK
jgi:hypothetical protein